MEESLDNSSFASFVVVSNDSIKKFFFVFRKKFDQKTDQ